MAAILSSPHIAPAAWGMDEAQLLSSPVARDAPLLNELDHSFGSSMSISSLDSPGRGPPRPRVTTTTRDVLTEDPFTVSPSAGIRAPQPGLWGVRSRVEPSYSKSSPHAMEISSPAAFQAVSAPMPAPTAPVHPVRAVLSRRADPTVRRSLPQLPSETELHCLSPPHEPPMKRRLSSLRQLQRASDPLVDQRVTQPDIEDAKEVRPWSRDRLATAWLPTEAHASSSAQLLPSPLPAPPTSNESADESWSFSGPQTVKRPCFASGSRTIVSPRGMGDYFFNPASPQVAQSVVPDMMPQSILDPTGFPTSSSPSSSPFLARRADALPDASGVFSHTEVQGTRDAPHVLVSTVPSPTLSPRAAASRATDTAAADESDDALMLGGSVPALHCGSPVRASLRKSRPVGMGARRCQTTLEGTLDPADKENHFLAPLPGAPVSPGVPGFGSFEMDRKTLPCFAVKSDGLMRVKPETVRDVLQGRYNDQIRGFQIVDCRFAYEHEGGHIMGATNLNTVEQVQTYFLTPGKGLHATQPLPERTQSGMPDESGDTRKFLVIFHCEFSWKRGPSMALALRAADRSLASDYPRCHFPDVYVLQGGYADFFRTCPELCTPCAYVTMDDPRFLRRRSEELVGFRKQFVRNRSFAYGDEHYAALSVMSARINAQGAPQSIAPPAARGAGATGGLATPLDRDTSFSSTGDSSFEADASFSPCAAATSRRPTVSDEIGGTRVPPSLMHAFARRPLQRAETMPAGARIPHPSSTAPTSPMRL
ncbi:protein-tyrosine-phosphatase [Malassezia brasiliensis]|uniref:M-phase inducer phosphatase n=1 Tax=Malassezia brasiliensis TaxID=1821822 RepID=A0AAF0DS31_9BASI|nr:protein-tyrosine-phosphatase [Malassezia brasiliensis]